MPTPEEIETAAATAAEAGIQSATGADGRSATQMDPLEQLDVRDRLAAAETLTGTNAQGGAKSPWNGLRPARSVPPGSGPTR